MREIRSLATYWIGGLVVLVLPLAGCPPPNGVEDVPTITPDTAADSSDTVADASETGPTCSDAATRDGGTCVCGGAVCGAHTSCEGSTSLCVTDADGACLQSDGPWTSGTDAFREASDAWGLPEIGADGVRISVTDFNGDGWPDLIVRTVGADRNQFGSNGNRTVWLLENTGDGSFADVTEESDFLATRDDSDGGRPAEVVVWGDVDNDGDLDAYTGFNKSSPFSIQTAEIVLNQGDGTFELGPESNEVRRDTERDMPAGATFLDYNRDGNLDLWITRYEDQSGPMQDHLYEGNGDGTFDEVTEQRGLATRSWREASTRELNKAKGHSRSWGSNACDLNGDGLPELIASSYGRAPNHLWAAETGSDGEISYRNISVDSGYAYDDATDWTDNEFAKCHCKLNPNAEDCDKVDGQPNVPCEDSSDVLAWNHDIGREKFRLGGNTGTTVCADFDGDGEMDLLNHEIKHWWAGSSSDPTELLYNDDSSEIRFDRPGRQQTGLTRTHDSISWDEGDITGGALDFDNDGRLDIYVGSTDYAGTRGLLYHQKPDGSFEQVDRLEGIDHKSSHGIALADFDRDGDVDIVVGHSRTRCGSGNHCYPKDRAHIRMFENIVGDSRNWLQVKLVGGEGTNRSAIGARITVETDDGTQVREVGGGHGHYGIQHDLTQHFGLGDACRAKVTVRWPNQSLTERTFVLKSGHRYRWKQGSDPMVADPNDE